MWVVSIREDQSLFLKLMSLLTREGGASSFVSVKRASAILFTSMWSNSRELESYD